MFLPLLAWLLLMTGASAVLGLVILLGSLLRVFRQAPSLSQKAEPLPRASLMVVVPAYNEADNIGSCLSSVLASAPPAAD